MFILVSIWVVQYENLFFFGFSNSFSSTKQTKVGHPVYLPYEGTIAFQGYNPADGDYGNCVITKHIIQDKELYMLFGHLNKDSIAHETGSRLIKTHSPDFVVSNFRLDKVLPAGYMIGRLGDRHENGLC